MNHQAYVGRHRLWFRAILGVLGGVQLANGLWAVLAPRSFYGDFPFGRGWVEALPAYNEHLMRDVGALFLATGFVLLAAAWSLERRLTAVALISYLLFSVPHAIYHFVHLGAYEGIDAAANAIVLVATVVLPAGLLVALVAAARDGSQLPGESTTGAGGPGRIEGVGDRSRNPLVRVAYLVSRRRYGAVMDPIRIFAHHPRVMLGYAAHELAAERAHRAPERLKHLAELRAGMLAGCEWCCDFGSALSSQREVDEEDMRNLPLYRASERFSDLEKLVLDYATGISRTPVEVPAELFGQLRRHLDEPQLVELTDIIALENYRARFNWAFGLEAQGFSEGSFCVRPEKTGAEPL